MLVCLALWAATALSDLPAAPVYPGATWAEKPPAALGHGGKRGVFVVPSLDLVASWNESPIDDWAKQAEAFRRLVRSVMAP